MDFTTGFPMTTKKRDSIMVVVGKFSKSNHFIQMKSAQKANDIALIFMEEVFKLHGIPKAIALNCDAKFTSNFWKGLFQYLGTQLNFSLTYQPQIDGQTERVNQVL